MLSRFSNVSFWNLDRKTSDTQLIARLSPFYQLDDTNLISNRSLFKTTTFINKTHPLWGADFTYGRSNYKQLLNAGFESRQVEDYKFNYRLNFSTDWSARLISSKTMRRSNSDFLQGRDYTIQHYSLSPELNWQPKPDFRLTLAYLWSDKLNLLGLEDKVTFNEYIIETRWAKSNQSNINGRIKFSDITSNITKRKICSAIIMVNNIISFCYY